MITAPTWLSANLEKLKKITPPYFFKWYFLLDSIIILMKHINFIIFKLMYFTYDDSLTMIGDPRIHRFCALFL